MFVMSDDGAERPKGPQKMSARPLRAEERALWAQVAKTTQPLRPQPVHIQAVPLSVIKDIAKKQEGQATGPARPKPKPHPVVPASRAAPKSPPQPVEDNNRRRLRAFKKGRIEIDAQIDLHGMFQANAHATLVQFVRQAQSSGHRQILVITGKGRAYIGGNLPDTDSSGVLRAALPRWLHEEPLRSMVVSYRPAAQRHGGAGAFYLQLKKRFFEPKKNGPVY